MTGLAVNNPGSDPVTASVLLRSLDGRPAFPAGTLTIASRGQTAIFLHQIEAFSGLQTPFRGILEIGVTQGSIGVLGLRSRYNERGDFLITSAVPLADNRNGAEFFFPHIADGGGYTTQPVLIGATDAPVFARLHLFTQLGRPVSRLLR